MQHKRATMLFALGGALNVVLSRLYDAPAFLAENGIAALLRELAAQLAIYFLLGCALLLALRGAARPPAQLLLLPWRFVVLLAAVSAALSRLDWILEHAFEHGAVALSGQSIGGFLETWFTIVLWGGLFGWLYLLYLQRLADQQRLDGMLARRALLTRQMAQTALHAARARIDPVAVAADLRAVQASYANDPAQGAAMLDQLIGRLRQVLRRNK